MKFLTQLLLSKSPKMVALTSSLFVVMVAFYNLSMDKLSKDLIQLEKVNNLIELHMPDFARRFFNDKKKELMVSSIYVYSIDLSEFFDYLGTTSYDIDKMKLSDLKNITPEIIEEYVEYLRTQTTDKGNHKVNSDQTVKKKLCVLSSFFDYYFLQGVIPFNPLLKVNRPKVPSGPPEGSDMQDNLKLLEFVSKGNLPGDKTMHYQDRLRNRDTAILALIMGAGLKASECVNLDISDIDLVHNCLIVKSRRAPNLIYFSPYITDALSRYLEERLEMIAVYGHDNALFLSLQMKRLCIRSVEILLKKYSSILFGDEHTITPIDMRNAFRKSLFMSSKNMFFTAEMTGTAASTLIRPCAPYMEIYETEKGKSFNPLKLRDREEQVEIQ